jgi:hypothetical protein
MLKELVSERDYWLALGEIEKGQLPEWSKLYGRLFDEIFVKFGVVRFADQWPSQFGLKDYADWWREQRRSYCDERLPVLWLAYRSIICSACPLSEGFDQFRQTDGEEIPCGAFCGTLYSLPAPFMCIMKHQERWGTDRLYRRIYRKGGSKAVNKFKIKEQSLALNFLRSKAVNSAVSDFELLMQLSRAFYYGIKFILAREEAIVILRAHRPSLAEIFYNYKW